MSLASISKHLPGTFTFLDPRSDDVSSARSVQEGALPVARKIFLADENATPLVGFPVLQSSRLLELEKALEEYLHLEERVQFDLALRRPFDRHAYAEAWRRYSRLLASATEYTVLSSYGHAYPNVFWLRHSAVVASCLVGTRARLAQLDAKFGRDQGSRIKYMVFFRYLDRALALTYQIVRRLARQVEERESDLFPGLLTVMRDNVLIFTEERISADVSELTDYLRGHLGVDERAFRQGLKSLRGWHRLEFARNQRLRRAVENLLGQRLLEDPDKLLHRPGYVRFLSELDEYGDQQPFESKFIDIWEELLPNLKEFELIRGFQGLVLPMTRENGDLMASDPRTLGTGLERRRISLSITTRPLDFMTPWVLDPEVGRFGLIYDLSQFSQALSDMNRQSQLEQERTFQMIFRFQRRINQIAFGKRLRLEKYLGDGALYSGINRPHLLLVVALLIQRRYREAVEGGFPFDQGLRMALNFGQYRMLPIQSNQPNESDRYEFFGHGIVELTRLITGKSVQQTDEMKKLLINLGYPQTNVEQFFAPLDRRKLGVVGSEEERRRFRAYINPNGSLVNEGIVATDDFITQLDEEGTIEHLALSPGEGHRRFVVASVREGFDTILAGIRKLGPAEFKGIGSILVYELVDGERWKQEDLQPCGHLNLLQATEEVFRGGLAVEGA